MKAIFVLLLFLTFGGPGCFFGENVNHDSVAIDLSPWTVQTEKVVCFDPASENFLESYVINGRLLWQDLPKKDIVANKVILIGLGVFQNGERATMVLRYSVCHEKLLSQKVCGDDCSGNLDHCEVKEYMKNAKIAKIINSWMQTKNGKNAKTVAARK